MWRLLCAFRGRYGGGASAKGRSTGILSVGRVLSWREGAAEIPSRQGVCAARKEGREIHRFGAEARQDVSEQPHRRADVVDAARDGASLQTKGCAGSGTGCVFVQLVYGVPGASRYLRLAQENVREDEAVLEDGLRFGSLYEGVFKEEIYVSQ